MRHLSPLEARVLGVLVEKQATVPDTYPLSLNALVAGCNQKTARDPVMLADEADVLTAVDGLRGLNLLIESSGGRVSRFEHNAGRGLGLPGQAVALLSVLMLRGPQTSAELRSHAERLHRFADISSVEGFLDELADKQPSKVLRLPRAPGSREPRWVHLLCGEPVLPLPQTSHDDDLQAVSGADIRAGELAALKAEMTRMNLQIQALQALLQRVVSELGLNDAQDGAASGS